MTNLFSSPQTSDTLDDKRPLADRLRPKTLSEVTGQEHITDQSMPLQKMIEGGNIASMILWGPPGCGKTTLARIIAENSGHHFEQLSAIFSGVKDLKSVFDSARIRVKDN